MACTRAAGVVPVPRPGEATDAVAPREPCYVLHVANVESRGARSADPYADLDVIDARAPRFNQAAVAIVCALALLTGWWGLASLMGLQLAVGLVLGRRWCLPCLFYFEVVQPLLGEGEVEDARPPRFANILGATFLAATTLLHLGGLSTAGWVLIGMVAALAALAAVTGLCVGCVLYKIGGRFRGVRPGTTRTIDLAELGVTAPRDAVVVQFTHPLCSKCRSVEARLGAEGNEVFIVDIAKRPDLARKYHVSVVPAAFTVRADGRVLSRIA